MATKQLSKKRTYGSIINRIQETACMFPVDYEVKVGLGATEYHYSDRSAWSVCSVDKNWKGKGYEIIGVQRDHAKRVNVKPGHEMSESQEYEYTPNHDAPVHYLKSKIVETNNGTRKMYCGCTWNPKTNRWSGVHTYSPVLGHRDEYFDHTF